jgi:predicted nucleic acid-binding protein
MRVLLDSTVLIDYLRGRPVVARVHALRVEGDEACTTAINVEEIVRGLRPGEQPGATALFAGLTLVPIVAADGFMAGDWRRTHAERGTTLWQADCLIAAVAARIGARLATANVKDFPMPHVRVEHWPVGS